MKPRETAVQSCRLIAEAMGNTIFALQAGFACFTAADAGVTYQKYGEREGCNDGVGGSLGNDVYEIRCSGTQKFTGAIFSE